MAVKITVYGEAKLDQLDRAKAQIAELERSVRANASGIAGALDRTGSRLQSLGSSLTSAGQTMTKGFTVPLVAAGAAVYKLTQAAAEDEKTQKILASQLKKNAGARDADVAATERWITAQGEAKGIADDKLRPALGILAGATKDVAKSQQLASLAMDISAARGIDLETVSKALAKGYTGNLGALSKLVPGISKASLQSKDFTQVQAELAKMVGGEAANAAETASGKWERMKLRLREAGEAIGYAFLPVLTKLADFVSTKIVPILVKFAAWLGHLNPKILIIAVVVAAAVAALGPLLMLLGMMTSSLGGLIKLLPLLGRAMSTAFGPVGIILGILAAAVAMSPQLREMFQNVLMKLVSKLAPIFEKLMTAVEPIVDALGGVLMKVISALAPPLMKLLDAFMPLVDVVLSLLDPILALLDPIMALIEPLLDLVMVILQPLIDLLSGGLGWAADMLSESITAMLPGLKLMTQFLGDKMQESLKATAPGWKLIGEFIAGVAEQVGLFIKFLSGKIDTKQLVDGLMNLQGPFGDLMRWVLGIEKSVIQFVQGSVRNFVNFQRTVQQKIGEVIAFFTGMPGRIADAVKDAATWLVSTGSNIVEGIRKGISDGWSSLVKWFNNLISGLVQGVKDLLGIHSPSRVFADMGSMMGEGMRQGLLGSIAAIRAAATAAAMAATVAATATVGVSAAAASDGTFAGSYTAGAGVPSVGSSRASVVIQSGAFQITVQGNADESTVASMKSGMNSMMEQLLREVNAA
ncbi:MAG: hypothetical protein KGL39_23045 [Patescibacteria group bacterium]|nr:hypothetical protein [Patescibacteria group bacterium]